MTLPLLSARLLKSSWSKMVSRVSVRLPLVSPLYINWLISFVAEHSLMQGFDLRAGFISVIIPTPTVSGAGIDYAFVRGHAPSCLPCPPLICILTAFGDSGNFSLESTIAVRGAMGSQ